MSFGEESGEEQGKQNFKYNGKELDKEHGLNQYDYAARFMDPGMIRFTTVDPLAEKYYSISPYAYVGNNPMRFIDPTGMEWEIIGSDEDKKAYLKMLYNSTGNNYKLDDNNKLSLVGADKKIAGIRSETLINTIQRGIASKDVYSLSLVGANGDDTNVFIDSYANKQIDVSDLKIIGTESMALQGAAIGHFLNEVQVGGAFETAHKPSLQVEGKIYGELVGDNSITTRKDYSIGAPIDGYQKVIFEYNQSNKFTLMQGATSTSRKTGCFIGPVEITETIVKANGQLKSVTKVK